MATKRFALTYHGDPAYQYLPGVPARDITADEVDELNETKPGWHDDAQASGWYQKAAISEVENPIKADRDGGGPAVETEQAQPFVPVSATADSESQEA